MINKEKFFSQFAFRPLNQKQVDALNFLLDKLGNSEVINRLSWVAYILATIKHETAETYKPITELGSSGYLKGKSYYPYIGRGFVQLTWKSNYQRFGEILGIDLVKNMELANDPETAWKILEIGMTKGLYTGKKLSSYLNDNGLDFWNSRRIINGTDQAGTIAGYAQKFYNILEWQEAPTRAVAEHGIDIITDEKT